MNETKLCVALDDKDLKKNLQLAKDLSEFKDLWVKVGFASFLQGGLGFLSDLKALDLKIFLDLKIYDIPNTMINASLEIAKLGVDMFNVHASSGSFAMGELTKELDKLKSRPLVLAVTALTSFNDKDFRQVYTLGLQNKTLEFAQAAYQSSLDGVVCSVFESLAIKQATSNKFITLSPGIRLNTKETHDQKRVADVKTAIKNKADFIVVGRPIYTAKAPKAVVCDILAQINAI